jgi:hypothetical protein
VHSGLSLQSFKVSAKGVQRAAAALWASSSKRRKKVEDGFFSLFVSTFMLMHLFIRIPPTV